VTGPYPDRNRFQSCPAGTGTREVLPCPHFPDEAHRCTLPRGEHDHECGCGHRWVTLWIKAVVR
jgi:hypothetical protein